ncbi:Alpha/beta superfamily hydrolase [Nitrosomonas cryotolerans]|uniref:Serine aminopeptidase, S33 n=2 Tax=Nitrosomonas cryotolerans TaxID=44575 RepID=A0A1N6JEW4_9PROT|nr:alpha/beta fold hydrolase [Nitrosomonas cryotolerans]SFP50129.1 Alpha/beta superfamily hydrolase [Nitrosomonas cryotolerans]SIO42679.1 Serine aminopeptidase, S33 [Nitrosomonas cryotolerans ATCC 49181]
MVHLLKSDSLFTPVQHCRSFSKQTVHEGNRLQRIQQITTSRLACVTGALKSMRRQGNRCSLVLLWLLMLCFTGSGWTMGLALEKTVCGIREPVIFWFWSSLAGAPRPARIANLSNAESISVSTTDGRMLQGYRLRATSSERDPGTGAKGYLLVAQGNAMLADQVLSSFTEFSQAGIDVYIFDYRGYGRSEGKPRFKAIVNDYQAVIAYLDSKHYSTRLFYGMSFGGIVLLNALNGTTEDSAIVIDSTPSRLSDYGCPQTYDPVENLPEDASNLLLITGLIDAVVKPVRSEELVELARARGAAVMIDPEMAHPFMDQNRSVHTRRIRAVKSFLLKEAMAD